MIADSKDSDTSNNNDSSRNNDAAYFCCGTSTVGGARGCASKLEPNHSIRDLVPLTGLTCSPTTELGTKHTHVIFYIREHCALIYMA